MVVETFYTRLLDSFLRSRSNAVIYQCNHRDAGGQLSHVVFCANPVMPPIIVAVFRVRKKSFWTIRAFVSSRPSKFID